MLAKRIIPCLDVRNGVVVKGIQFKNHQVMGDILDYAKRYENSGADELVFYDITASCDNRTLDINWISNIARFLDIPFCVAGGIRTLKDARAILNAGADKISINSPALENPDFISQLAREFGSQCVVIGIDSREQNGDYYVYQYTGDVKKTCYSSRRTEDWVRQVQRLGAGEIVLNCMNQDGVKQGYDVKQLSTIRAMTSIPLIASGGAGNMQHFKEVFEKSNVDGTLAASVFHSNEIEIHLLKQYLKDNKVEVRL